MSKAVLISIKPEWCAKDEDLAFAFDCPMPEDGQEILVKTVYGVDKDICYIDGGTYLEGKEWEDVLAWAEMPKGERGEDNGRS